MMGKRDASGVEHPGPLDLVRLALPRRVYTQSHLDYAAQVVRDIWCRREQLGGFALTFQAPVLRHFTARLERITVASPFRQSALPK